MEDVYQILIENFTNERLDKIAYQDNDFVLLDQRLEKLLKRYDTLPIPKRLARKIDKVFDAYAAQSARYATLAYKQGIEDAVVILKEIGVIWKWIYNADQTLDWICRKRITVYS